MATTSAITAPSGREHSFTNALDAFETIQGKFSVIQSLIESASDGIGVDHISHGDIHIIEAARMIASQVSSDFQAAVAMGYAAIEAGAAA